MLLKRLTVTVIVGRMEGNREVEEKEVMEGREELIVAATMVLRRRREEKEEKHTLTMKINKNRSCRQVLN